MSSARRSRPSSATPHRESSHLHHVSTAVPPYFNAHAAASGGLAASASGSTLAGRPRERDAEQLTLEVRSLKEAANASAQENAFLKTQMQRLVAQLRKKDRQLEQVMEMKVSAVSDAGADAILAGQLRELRSELTTIARVTDKCRELEGAGARKDEEIRRLKAAVKFTNINELELEAQTYYNEARRMRKALTIAQQQAQQAHAHAQQLQTQLQQLQAQRDTQALSPSSVRGSSTARASGPISPSAASTARDHDLFLQMRNELSALRAENLRLRSEEVHGQATGRGGNPAAPPLHVLHKLTQLQRELQQQIADDEQMGSDENMHDRLADSAEYHDDALSTDRSYTHQQTHTQPQHSDDSSYSDDDSSSVQQPLHSSEDDDRYAYDE